MIKSNLLTKINDRKLIVGIIGLGYVGLPLAMSCVDSNYKVIGFDTDLKKLEKLESKKSYIFSIDNKKIKKAFEKGFKVTKNFQKLKNCDCIIICVPTPLNSYKQPELKYVFQSVSLIKSYLRDGQLIILESTTYPGTTKDEVLPMLEDKQMIVGKNFYLSYSPEREDPGNESYITRTIPKVVGGITKDCLKISSFFYKTIVNTVVEVSSTQVAEMTKLHENIYRLINLGLVNEMKIICDKFDINIHEVIEAASTKPFGFTPYYPGPGVGGHCIPVDPYYLSWKTKQFSLDTEFINLANKINENMPDWVINKTLQELEKKSLSLTNKKIHFIGVSYKKNVDDIRNSPSMEIMKKITEYKVSISYTDEYIKFLKLQDFNNNKINLKSVKLTERFLNSIDIVFITTDHDNFDYKFIKKHSKIIIDTRGIYRVKNKKIVIA